MKRLFSLILLIAVCLLTACQSSTTQAPKNKLVGHPLFVDAEEVEAVKKETDIEGIWEHAGTVDFDHLMRLYYVDHVEDGITRLCDSLSFSGEYAAPLNNQDGTLYGFALLWKNPDDGKYLVGKCSLKQDILEEIREMKLDENADLYFLFNPAAWDEAVLMVTENREIYYTTGGLRPEGFSGEQILREARETFAYNKEHPDSEG